MLRLDLDKLLDRRFPSKGQLLSTHYEDCYHRHPGCAYMLGVRDAVEAMKNEEAPTKRGFLS